MVVKTDLCSFSENRVYPGHGRRFVTRNGQTLVLSSSKVQSLYHQRKKPAKLMWTQAWRRMHKKLNVETSTKRKVRRVVKVLKAPVGTSLEKIAAQKKASVAKPKTEGVVKQAAVAEVKKAMKEKAKQNKVARAAQAPKAPTRAVGGKGR